MTEHYSIIVARKPLSEKTIVDNVLKWGTGGINIDGCRIGTEKVILNRKNTKGSLFENDRGNAEVDAYVESEGRFPANIIFDEEAGKILDEQSGISKSSGGTRKKENTKGGSTSYSKLNLQGDNSNPYAGEVGGASRFFYKPLTEEEYENQQINNIENMSNITLLKGDCLEKLKELEDNSIDSVVTDPPYEIGFMNKGWDDSGIANNPELWKEVLRVLKPGGHLLSFSHSRTYHRQAVAVEDSGFEIRDQILWVYGSGFPKSHNIGKSVDKIQGNEREVVGEGKSGKTAKAFNLSDKQRIAGTGDITGEFDITKGNSPYEGWGTALKPAHEPIVMARKPFKGTVAENVLEWGTGGINIDDSRIGTDDNLNGGAYAKNPTERETIWGEDAKNSFKRGGAGDFTQPQGRFPANIIFDEEAGKILDEQTGILKSGKGAIRKNTKNQGSVGFMAGSEEGMKMKEYDDEGGASRFFYCPKASKKDRNEGCDELEDKIKNKILPNRKCIICDEWEIRGAGNGVDYCKCENPIYEDKTIRIIKNSHPTVKPTDLMAYLVRLVTPKGGTVLDPFMGSGSTGKAAVREGFNFIGIEREDEYMEIAKSRIEHELGKNKHRQFFDE